MNIQIFIGFFTAMWLVVDIEANCCKRKGPLCCGNGKCDMHCCNCDGGCNAHCERSNLTRCTLLEWIECSGLVILCAAACVDPADPLCEECLGPMYDTCVRCFGRDVDKQRAFDDTKNMLDACLSEMLPYNVDLVQLLKTAEEENKKGGH